MAERTPVAECSRSTAVTAAGIAAFVPLEIYTLSKLCNLWFTFKLAEMLQQAGLPVTVDAVTPGFVPNSNLGKAGLSW